MTDPGEAAPDGPIARAGRAIRAAVPSLLTALTVCSVVILLGRVQAGQVKIVADLDADGGSAAELFLNGSSEPLRTPTQLGRFRYEFGISSTTIEGIRLDPVDAAEVQVRIYGIEVWSARGQVLARYGPDAIEQWTMRGLAVVERTADVLVLRTTSDDPMLIGQVPPVHLEPVAGAREQIAARLRADPGLLCLLLLPLLSLFEVRPYGAWIRRALGAIAVCAAGPAIFRAVSNLDWGPTPVEVAVSRAAYVGLSLPSTQAGMLAAFAATALAGVLLAFLFVGVRPGFAADGGTLPGGTGRFLGFVVLGLVLVNTPDLAGLAGWMASMRYAPHWDYDNVLYWAYWTAHGAAPFRDFWYPYAGLFLFDLTWPTGPLIAWGAAVGREAVFAAALTLAFPSRRLEVLVATAALLAAETLGLNLASARYLLGANVILAYMAAQRWGFRRGLPLLTLTTALVMALVFEPAQLVYAAPGIASIALLDAARARRMSVVWRGPVVCATVLSVSILVLAAVLWRAGMLGEAWEYHRRLADTVQYAALPTTVAPDPWADFRAGAMVVWLPCVALIIGFADLRRRDPEAFWRATVLIALAMLGFATLQKHLVRPMPDTLALDALIIGLVFGALTPPGRFFRYRLGAGAAVGLLVGVLVAEGRVSEISSSAASLPSRLTGTFRMLVSGPALAEANRVRFAPERFELYTAQRQLAAELSRRRQGPVRLFTLSDDAIAYVMSGQAPVRQVNLYNGSPVYEQRRIIDDLRGSPPDYVVVQPGRLSFDAVPVAVRVPDVVRFVIEHYVPDEPVRPYVVLRPKQADEHAPFEFWSGLFGDLLDLGRLPAVFGRAERPTCAEARECDELIVLTPTGPLTGEEASLGLVVGEASVRLRFGLDSWAVRYVIPLSRLWPSVAAGTAGLSIDVTPPPGFRIERLSAGRADGRLY